MLTGLYIHKKVLFFNGSAIKEEGGVKAVPLGNFFCGFPKLSL